MKKLLIFLLIVVNGLLSLSDVAVAASSQEAFAQLLRLEGIWEGEWKGDKQSYPMRLTFEPISEKAALMETLHSLADNTKMTTIYHTDGAQLMATHYCRFNNQPRLTAQASNGTQEQLEFHFLDGRNLSGPHVVDILFQFVDENTIIQTYRFKGSDIDAAVKYTRVK